MGSKATKQKIIEVASMLFGRYGFYKTSMDEVAKTAHKAKGSLYYHFKSKEELFTAVVDAEFKVLRMQLLPIVEDNTLKADEKFRRYLMKRMEVLSNSKNYQETLRADFFEKFDFISKLREEIREWEKIQMQKIINQGIEEGIFLNISDNMDQILDVFMMVQRGLEVPFFLQGQFKKYAPNMLYMINVLMKCLSK
jgi:AcrR family transcriptional regulator